MPTKISWVKNPDGTDGETWSPVVGCSFTCPWCWARKLHTQRRKALLEGKAMPECYRPPFDEPTCYPERLAIPLRWRKPKSIFVCSVSDLFGPEVPFEYIAAVFGVMAACPRHRFYVLTKQPERMVEWYRWLVHGEDSPSRLRLGFDLYLAGSWPLPNVWIGVSVENAAHLDRLNHLRQCPAALRFVSFEPLLSAVHPDLTGIDWVICGPKNISRVRQPMPFEWAKNLHRQCRDAGVPFFWKPDDGLLPRQVPVLGGREHGEVPR